MVSGSVRPRRAALIAAVGAALALVVLLPAIALAHAELESAVPTPGSTVAGSPPFIRATFSEVIDPGRSWMEVRGPDGSLVAKGGIPKGDPPGADMQIALPELAPGTYEVRWTTVTADDNGIERGTYALTIAAASPTPGPSAPTGATLPASAAPSTEATDTAAPVSGTPSASTAVAASGSGGAGGSSGGSDIVTIIGIVVVFVAIAGVGLFVVRGPRA